MYFLGIPIVLDFAVCDTVEATFGYCLTEDWALQDLRFRDLNHFGDNIGVAEAKVVHSRQIL